MGMWNKAKRVAARFLLGNALDEELAERVEGLVAERLQEERDWHTIADPVVRDVVAGRLAGYEAESDAAFSGYVSEGVDTYANIAQEDRGWRSASGGAELQRVQRQSAWLYDHNPIARNILRNYVFLTVGEGAQVKFEDRADQDKWKAWATAVNFAQRHKQFVLGTYMFGEQPIVLFPLSPDSGWIGAAGRIETPTGDEMSQRVMPIKGRRTACRPFSPLDIQKTITDRDDACSLQYLHRSKGDRTYGYAAHDLLYPAINTINNGVRGRPVLEPVLRHITYLNGFVQDRVIANAVRTRIPLVREVPVSGSRVATEGQKFSTLPRPGTIVTTGGGEKWGFPSLNLGAGDATNDFRMLSLMVAAGVNLPEFLVFSDASNANRASLEQAFDAIGPMFDDYRDLFADMIADLAEWVIGRRPSVVFVQSAARDDVDRVRAYTMAVDDKLMARQTAAQRMGLDYSAELDKMENDEDQLMRRGLIDPADPDMADVGNRRRTEEAVRPRLDAEGRLLVGDRVYVLAEDDSASAPVTDPDDDQQ